MIGPTRFRDVVVHLLYAFCPQHTHNGYSHTCMLCCVVVLLAIGLDGAPHFADPASNQEAAEDVGGCGEGSVRGAANM
jgi:hypothetical protein